MVEKAQDYQLCSNAKVIGNIRKLKAQSTMYCTHYKKALPDILSLTLLERMYAGKNHLSAVFVTNSRLNQFCKQTFLTLQKIFTR